MKSRASEAEAFAISRYNRTAWFYEKAAHVYSVGQILESKRWQLKSVNKGDHLLFVGAGSGEDVILAAQQGAIITVIDIAPKMLERIEVKLKLLGLEDKVILVCGDAFEHHCEGGYDIVFANYFLNVFSPRAMRLMYKHLALLVRRGGLMMIADFAPANGNLVQVCVQLAYYYSAVSAFHLIARNPLHKIYDYTQYAQDMGLTLVDQASFRVLRGQSNWYRSLALEKT